MDIEQAISPQEQQDRTIHQLHQAILTALGAWRVVLHLFGIAIYQQRALGLWGVVHVAAATLAQIAGRVLTLPIDPLAHAQGREKLVLAFVSRLPALLALTTTLCDLLVAILEQTIPSGHFLFVTLLFVASFRPSLFTASPVPSPADTPIPDEATPTAPTAATKKPRRKRASPKDPKEAPVAKLKGTKGRKVAPKGTKQGKSGSAKAGIADVDGESTKKRPRREKDTADVDEDVAMVDQAPSDPLSLLSNELSTPATSTSAADKESAADKKESDHE